MAPSSEDATLLVVMAKLNDKCAQVNDLTKHLWAVHDTAERVHRKFVVNATALVKQEPAGPHGRRRARATRHALKLHARLSNLRETYKLLNEHYSRRHAEWLDLLRLATVYTTLLVE